MAQTADQTAERPWAEIFRHAFDDLQPFEGRFGQAWRIALLCAIVSGVAMMYKIPEAAISCYLIIYLTRPDGAYCVSQGIGIIIIATLAVAGMAPVIQATADAPMLRIVIIAGASFAFVWLGSASQLGEMGSIGGLVVAFILTLVDEVPAAQIVSRGLIDAWKMAVMPMVLMIVFNLVLGRSPQRLLREAITARLDASAAALEGPASAAARRLDRPLSEGNGALGQHLMLGGIFHTAPSAEMKWLSGAATTSYRLLLAVAALPASVTAEARAALA
ncbi:MAG: FUSC family protein, partial [Rhizobiales bacterium]|nr:FUSC family protein [Hyphomicrobiales bacterium]